MMKGTYIGPDENLWGLTAMIRVKDNEVLAQFDDMESLPHSLTHSWTAFDPTSWEISEPVQWEETFNG